jgi:hypothetical protein
MSSLYSLSSYRNDNNKEMSKLVRTAIIKSELPEIAYYQIVVVI